jgi:hypothetical protein
VKNVKKMMPEAEISLRLALGLIDQGLAKGRVDVAVDGAQVRTGQTVHFDPARFLGSAGWQCPCAADGWRGTYARDGVSTPLRVHATPGKGDVVARLSMGRTLRVECKKGPLSRSRSSQEYPLIREALGQLLTVEEVTDKDVLAVAVPHTDRFADLAARWRKAPLIMRLGIRILTVDRQGKVHGFE